MAVLLLPHLSAGPMEGRGVHRTGVRAVSARFLAPGWSLLDRLHMGHVIISSFLTQVLVWESQTPPLLAQCCPPYVPHGTTTLFSPSVCASLWALHRAAHGEALRKGRVQLVLRWLQPLPLKWYILRPRCQVTSLLKRGGQPGLAGSRNHCIVLAGTLCPEDVAL